MAKRRKRAAGGGRKPRGEFSQLTSLFAVRMPKDMRKQLESNAAERNQSVAQRLLWHLRQSFNREREKERDPALQGLLFMIGQLAERFGGQKDWRTDLLYFRAFKLAVGKLLDEIEEPPGPMVLGEGRQKELKERFHDSEVLKILTDVVYSSPESLAEFVFAPFWSQVEFSHRPLGYDERKMMRDYPHLEGRIIHEHYGFQDALKALQLTKPDTIIARRKRRQ
jgi:hypothetical protein